MQRLWTVVLRTGGMHRVPVVGRDAAIKRACELLDQGVPVSHICPVAIEHDTNIIQASEIRRLAAELRNTPAADTTPVAQRAQPMQYRLYFQGPKGIIGRDDFDADGDAEALTIADALFDACSDLCTSFDLWQGGRRVPIGSGRPRMSAHDVHDRAQTIVIEREEAILQSRWTIAESKRLLARTDEAYRSRVLSTV